MTIQESCSAAEDIFRGATGGDEEEGRVQLG
jgi:hypothetical protein